LTIYRWITDPSASPAPDPYSPAPARRSS
jgi:hypothetical protein